MNLKYLLEFFQRIRIEQKEYEEQTSSNQSIPSTESMTQLSTIDQSIDQDSQDLESYLLAQQYQFEFEGDQEDADNRMLFNLLSKEIEEYDVIQQVKQFVENEQSSIESHDQAFLQLQQTLQREKEEKSQREVIVTRDNQRVVQLIKGEKCCFICAGQLFSNYGKVSMTECQHFFHASCLNIWKIDQKKSCPKCHSKVKSGSIQEVVSTSELNQSIPSNQENNTKVI